MDTQQHAIGKDFILAGRAIFTVVSITGERYTFKVTRKDSTNPRFPAPSYFAAVMTGSANDSDSSYDYVGIVQAGAGTVKATRNSKITPDDVRAKVLNFALSVAWGARALPAGYKIHHEGRCGRCGRLLTVPESIVTGFGPECSERMGLTAPAGWLPVDGNGLDSVDRGEIATGVQ